MVDLEVAKFKILEDGRSQERKILSESQRLCTQILSFSEMKQARALWKPHAQFHCNSMYSFCCVTDSDHIKSLFYPGASLLSRVSVSSFPSPPFLFFLLFLPSTTPFSYFLILLGSVLGFGNTLKQTLCLNKIILKWR